MNKKIGISFIFALTFFLFFHQSNPISYASEICTSEEECEEMIQDTQDRITDLERQESAVQSDIATNEADLANTQEQIAQMEVAIQSLQNNIAGLQRDITQKEGEIEFNQSELARLDIEIYNLQDLISGRMRVTQRMSRNNVLLEVLSESENFIDLIRRFRLINHLSQNDAETMDNLRDLVEQQQHVLTSLRTQKAELSSQQAELNLQSESLEAQSATLATYQAQLESQQTELAEQMHEIQAAMVSEQEAIEIARQQQEVLENTPVPEVILPPASSNTPEGSEPSNPTPSAPAPSNPGSPQVIAPPTNQMFIIPLERGRVTCEFDCYAGHTGIDLGNFGDTSTRVLAAAAGVVTRSGWHNMFGNHVMITHNINGQMFTTVYAHLHQTPFVSVGQQVQQGQVLGTMGNTGNSFGAHLHFEIYIGPFNWPHAVNPRRFIHFPASW